MARIVRYDNNGRVLDYVPDGIVAEWEGKANVLIDPSEGAVAGLPISQWRVASGALRVATPSELAADVAADNLVRQKALRQRAIDALSGPDYILERAQALWVLDQLNTIRAGLPVPLAAITPLQMRNGTLAKMNSGDAD